MGQVFISHVEEDARAAIEIAQGIEAAGFTTWYYERDSLPGISYLLQTKQAIEQSQALILMISKASLASHQITREVVRAHESGKAFIPVLVDVSHAEFQSRQPEWAEAIGAAASVSVPAEGVESIIPRLVMGLQVLGIFPRAEETGASSPVETGGALPGTAAVQEDEKAAHCLDAPMSEVAGAAGLRPRWITIGVAAAFVVLAAITAWSLSLAFFARNRQPGILQPSFTAAGRAGAPEISTQPAGEVKDLATSSPQPGLVEEATPQPIIDAETPGALAGEPGAETQGVGAGYLLPLADVYDLVFDGKLRALFDGQLVTLELVEAEKRFKAAERESGFNANSLAWDPAMRQFWAVRGSPHIVYRDIDVLDPSGAPVHTYRAPDAVGYLRYIAWDGTYLWATTSDETLVKWLPSKSSNDLQLVDSFAPRVGDYTGREASGLTWDGESLWMLTDNVLARLDSGARIACKIRLPSIPNGPSWYGYRGLAWDGQTLWVGHAEENSLYRIDPGLCQ